MKTTIKLLIVWCCTFGTTAVFGQVLTWIGPNGADFGYATNWSGDNGSGGTTPITDTICTFDGTVPGNLTIYSVNGINGTGAAIGGSFGANGTSIDLAPTQTGTVTITCDPNRAASAGWGFNAVRMQSGAASIILGDNTEHQFVAIFRPTSGTHTWINQSTSPFIINPNFQIQNGGGQAGHIVQFQGTGDFNITNNLRFNNGAPPEVLQWQTTGSTIWQRGGNGTGQDINRFNSGLGNIILDPGAGPLIIKSSGLVTADGGTTVQHDGTLINLDAAGQVDTVTRAISGTGPIQVSSGTWTFSSGASTFSGGINLTGGTLIAGGAENAGVSGPLGLGGIISFAGGTLGFSVNNTFDYSPRFDTAASQQYKIDTEGQNVTLATGLSSSSGTLTKSGPGTLTLSGTSSYSGATTVSGGRLVFQGSKTGTGNITVADGATVAVTDTGTQVTPSTLTLGTSGSVTLGFYNVNSTTTAPLAAGTLSAASTVTINVNGGTFAVGQSYPLLTWTSGSAPAVSLGVVVGAVGNLSVVGNTLQLNVTALADVWSGVNNGSWDTTTANNWLRGGSPVLFADSDPVLFDDTAAGTPNVTISGALQPANVTVFNSSIAFSIASSSGNNLGGSASLTKGNGGALTLSGGFNSYSGPSTLFGGTVTVGTLANGGSPSDIGSSSSAAANLVLDGGSLQFSGGAAGSDRLFTLGTGGGTIDASGTGALNLTNSGSVALSGSGARVLTLAGTNLDNNTLAASLGDSGGATSLTKSGPGNWVLSGTNTHSGGTTIAGGTLQVGAGGAGGALGSGNVTANGQLVFNRTGTLTVDGVISGNGAVTKNGSATLILANNNTYSGGTTISAGTLQLGNGGATGGLNSNGAITNNSLLVFDSTGAFNYSGNGLISGTGNVIVRGNGNLIKAIGANTYTGWTLIEAGATFQPSEGNQGTLLSSVVTNNGTLKLVRQDTATFYYSNNIVGTGRLLKDVNNDNANDVTLLGNNTYSGGTIIAGGEVVLGDSLTPGTGSIVGDVIFTNSPTSRDVLRGVTFNRPDDVTFAGNITGPGGTTTGGTVANAGRVVHNGTNGQTLTLTGNNTYLGGTVINAGRLQMGDGGTSGSVGSGTINLVGLDSTFAYNRSDNVALANNITGAGNLEKLGAGTLTLTGPNTYTGSNLVSSGTLIINGNNAASMTVVDGGTFGGSGTLAGSVTTAAGSTLAPGASVGTLTITNNLDVGGNIAIELNKSLALSNDVVVVGGTLNNSGSGTLTVANLGPALQAGDTFTLFNQPLVGGGGLTVTGAGATWQNDLATDGSITVLTVTPTQPTLNFTQTGNNLEFSWSGGGVKLQSQTNNLNVGISSNWGDYPGGGTSPVNVTIDPTKGTVFFRLAPTP